MHSFSSIFRRQRLVLFVLINVFGFVVLSLAAPGGVLAQESEPVIKLKAGTIVPSEFQVSSATIAEEMISGNSPGEQGYYIVQFRGPVEETWKEEVTAAGAELLGYLPDFAFKVRMTPEVAEDVGQLTDVNWVGLFQPTYKLDPNLEITEYGPYTVIIEDGADVDATMTEIEQVGVEFIRGDGQNLTIKATDEQVTALSRVLDVAWIDAISVNETKAEVQNEFGAGAILGANLAHSYGFDGSTQTVAVADTGLGGGTTVTAHTDIASGQVDAIFDWPTPADACYTVVNDGPIDADSGHGTHVTSSLIGSGDVTGLGKGAAPSAKLIFQAVEDYITIVDSSCGFGAGYVLGGLPNDLTLLFQQAYNANARVHSDSWGSSGPGLYTEDSQAADAFIRNNPDMTIVFSAGNEGVDLNDTGIVDAFSIGSPATAKNVIAVGASENARANYDCDTSLSYLSDQDDFQFGQTCSSMGGSNLLGKWGDALDVFDVPVFGVDPLQSDPTAGNAEQLASFSSRGPTLIFRVKPDLIAPGSWVLSGYSGLFRQGYGDPVNPQTGMPQNDGIGIPYNSDYKYFSGTSMATPLVAGAAVVVRDFYTKTDSHHASAALVKATLINTAVDMLDENNDGANDNDWPIPNYHEGWGRVDLATAVNGRQEYLDVTAGVTTGISNTHIFEVNSAGSPFKATLVWSDSPASLPVTTTLVNNLDLVVIAPGSTRTQRNLGTLSAGVTYLGNQFNGGWAQSGGAADTINNVESVYVQSAETGSWTIQVKGTNVPMVPQPYAVVVSGEFDVPLAVTLNSFVAERVDNAIVFSWQMATESGTAGFHVLAESEGGSRQLTDELIPSQAIDSLMPTDYTYSVATEATVFSLHEHGVNGGVVVHGPFKFNEDHVSSSPDGASSTIWLPFIRE